MTDFPAADGEDDLADVEQELRADIEEEGGRPGKALEAFVEELREENDESVRGIGFYDHEGVEILYLREEIRAELTDEEIDERLKTFAMIGLAESPSDSTLEDYGHLDATLRWYDNAIVAVYPLTEWSGVIATFERRASPLIDAAMTHLY
ncbi:hypothetical protein [Halogeometricum luteum]|uniref:Uncharacterized protein n=1 Tax=Halogeometricum luteum TaxID=2950537 RepID=A0ABU2G5W1_9EURY|nr:hypothetical protein [Halogeometricum sp. S3BR5-2]MDS0296176.1 hypothetical protein [Halogeometricum sp. S3BR5-2]